MEGGSGPIKRKNDDEAEDGNTLDPIIEESLQHSHIKRERFEHCDVNVTVDVTEPGNEPLVLSCAEGIVMCGQCKQHYASVVCMERACVSFANRTWQMTSLFICDGCDVILHDSNPIMAEHIRTRLALKKPFLILKSSEKTKVVTVTVPSTQQEVEETRADDTPGVSRMDVESSTVRLKHPTLHSKLCSRQLNLMLEKIHTRYRTVLEHSLSRCGPLSDTFRETGVARQTLMDAIAIAELKIVDPRRFDEVMAAFSNAKSAPRMFEIESECRLVMRDYLDAVAGLRGISLIPFKCNVYSAKK